MTVDSARYATIRAAVQRLGYWFPTHHRDGSAGAESYDLFVYGIRGTAAPTSNRFDDVVGVAYIDSRGAPCVEEWPATTDPGRASLDHPGNPEGCATLIPGQIRRCWQRGLHHGVYPCLVPVPGVVMPVWRGTDRSRVWTDAHDLQLHHAGASSVLVDAWSAGCQTLQREADLARVLDLLSEQERRGLGGTVTYTLLDAAQV